MSWNYRLIRKNELPDHDTGEMHHWYGIHEVYYAEDGETIKALSVNPIAPGGETASEVSWSLERMQEAMSKPCLIMEELEARFAAQSGEIV